MELVSLSVSCLVPKPWTPSRGFPTWPPPSTGSRRPASGWLPPSTVAVENGFVTRADGYTILSNAEVNSAYSAITGLTVPVSESTTIKVQGVKSAFEATRTMVYDKATDSITNTKTGDVYTVQKVGISEYFVNANGNRLPQSWKQNVGLANYSRLLSDGKIASQFFQAFLWTLTFAFGSVLLTFILGFFLALVLNDDRIKRKKFYRSFLLLP